jgi:phage baseplate assembly protein W
MMVVNEAGVLGRGFAFPPRVGPDGRWAWSAGAENIRESIRVILLTEAGERVMLRDFGGGLKQFLFRPNTTSTHRLIEKQISDALERWEPRIRLESVDVQASADDPQTAVATIRYRFVATRQEDQLRFQVRLA